MSTNSASIQSEIDAIIARAMQEYQAARGVNVIDPFTVVAEEAANIATEEEPIVEEPTAEESGLPEIPINSTSILVDEQTSRFSSAIWYNNVQSKQVTLAGLGGIGSYVAFLLGRLHIRELYIYDDDVVEAGNMSGQLFESSHFGKKKARSITDVLYRFASFYNTSVFEERFTENSSPTDIMICGFDNMGARRTFYERWKQLVDIKSAEDKKGCLFIDGRLAAESLQVLCIRGDDTYNMNRYENEFLFDDSEAEETICSYKQTSFMANMIGSFIINLFVNFCANECDPLIPRDLPFFTEYTAETLYLKVVN